MSHGLVKRLSLCICTALLVASCAKQNKQAFYNTGIIYCSESNPVTFNPQLDTSSTTSDASSHQLYDRLLDFDPESGRIVPSLASSWLVSDDGLTYAFQLQKDVWFHSTRYFTPTRNFNADDVIFSINRWRLRSHPYHYVSGGRYPYFESIGLAQNIASVERVNGYRVEITLKRRDSSFLSNLATDFAVILSEEYAEQLTQAGTPSKIDELPVGTGPFKFDSYRKDHFIKYLRHDNYWRDQLLDDDTDSETDTFVNAGDSASQDSQNNQSSEVVSENDVAQTSDVEKTVVEQLIFDITPRSSLRLAKLMTGECDATAFPAQTELEVIRAKENLTLAENQDLTLAFGLLTRNVLLLITQTLDAR